VPGTRAGRQIVTPRIEDAERLQGFPSGWTDPATVRPLRNGPRRKLVGNAVTVDVARWLAGRLHRPGEFVDASQLWQGTTAWPTAAWGEHGKVWRVDASEYPTRTSYRHLLDLVESTWRRL
jgi:DNA (cytosine-5)-methyltransferase 1